MSTVPIPHYWALIRIDEVIERTSEADYYSWSRRVGSFLFSVVMFDPLAQAPYPQDRRSVNLNEKLLPYI